MLYTLNDCPEPLSLSVMQKLMDEFIKFNNIKVFLESDDLTKTQKSFIREQVENLEAAKNYSSVLSEYIGIKIMKEIREIVPNPKDYRQILKYLEYSGDLRMNEENRLEIVEDYPERDKKQLEKVPVRTIREIISSQSFSNFKK